MKRSKRPKDQHSIRSFFHKSSTDPSSAPSRPPSESDSSELECVGPLPSPAASDPVSATAESTTTASESSSTISSCPTEKVLSDSDSDCQEPSSKRQAKRKRVRKFFPEWLKRFPWLQFDGKFMTCEWCKVHKKESIWAGQGTTNYR